jgi:aminoglycoside phosphotransferase (APT) family kinase protein
VLDRYARASGRDLAHVDWYVALATLKMAVIIAGARRRLGTADPERAEQAAAKARLIASMALEATDRLPGRPP